MTPPFTRARRARNTQDAVGRVVVSVVLHDTATGSHQRGNITRSFSLNGTRVSVVAAALEKVLGK
jgi:hypothetical protein